MNSFFKLSGILTAGLVLPSLLLLASIAYAACPPPVRIVSSIPADKSKGADPSAPVVIVWDKTTHPLPAGTHDYKPMLESINIAGGRYGMGTLLTTEWGIGGTVSWKDNVETIIPEAPLEPGTQYRLWTYLYLTIRDDKPQSCARIGGEVVFKTSGAPPDDGNTVRNIDLSKIYHGDEYGHGDITGNVKELNPALDLMTVDDIKKGRVSVVIYKGVPVLKEGQFVPFGMIQVGDKVSVRFTGGRAVTVDIQNPLQ